MFATVLVVLVLSDYVAGGNIPVNDLLTDVGLQSIYKRLSSLEVNLKQQANENAALKQTVHDLREENRQLRNEVNTLHVRDSDMENVLNELRNSVKQLDACSKDDGDEIQTASEYIGEPTDIDEYDHNDHHSDHSIALKKQFKSQMKGKNVSINNNSVFDRH